MKQKKSKWLVYAILIALLGGVFYFSMHDITPVSKHIEKDLTVNLH